MSNLLNRYIVYGVAAAVAGSELQHPDPHIEPTNNTAPIQQARTVAVSTSTGSGPRTYYKELTVEQGSSASVAAIPFRLT
jgi:hypothetical protein